MLWFKHDTNAHSDAKLKKVRMKYGADGYAIYWYCLECIAGRIDKDNLTFNLEEDSEIIAYELSIAEHRVQDIMKYMVSLALFEEADGIITCLKLSKRLDKSMTNSPKMRQWLDLNKQKSVMTCADKSMTNDDTISTCAELEENRIEKNINNTMSDSSESDSQKKVGKVPYQKIADLYKAILVDTDVSGLNLIDMQKITTKRKNAIKKYWTREGSHGIERVEAYFNWIWTNRNQHTWIFGSNDRGWKADIEYLLREDTIAKALEGRLGNFGSSN